MQQFDIRKKLPDEQSETGSEEFVIIDEQYAHRIVSRQHMHIRTDEASGVRIAAIGHGGSIRTILHAVCR
ncbi:hypothetical protein [Paraburkholderia sp. 31.1]|uniref:hypothetical protein n=1 Tax=Paraburkholderia sp. 31.1 TaxID=2615205 RepID=UPI00165509D3|nr:hypothetical protein [Paraburkholderia sp. 31.1]